MTLNHQQKIAVRDMQEGRVYAYHGSNPVMAALRKHGLVEWRIDTQSPWGGAWELTDEGKKWQE